MFSPGNYPKKSGVLFFHGVVRGRILVLPACLSVASRSLGVPPVCPGRILAHVLGASWRLPGAPLVPLDPSRDSDSQTYGNVIVC